MEDKRIQRPVLILGALDGVLSGVRQQIRARRLEVQDLSGITVPTLQEMVRIKAWLYLTRNTTRDLLDVVALLERLGEEGLSGTFSSFDSTYERGPEGGPPLVELVERLAASSPVDRAALDLQSYKGVKPPWNDSVFLAARARLWASRLAGLVLDEGPQRG